MPLKQSVGPEVVALGGVVVDHVEDHLDAGRVQRPCTIALNSCDLLPPASPVAAYCVVRGEEADRVVAPVVAQAPVEQRAVVDELVHRHQLDRGHAELLAGAR